jgi:hypothetical protein
MKFLFWLFFFSFSTSFILVKGYKGYMESEWAYVDQVKSMGYLNQTVCKQDLIQKSSCFTSDCEEGLAWYCEKALAKQ